MLIICYFVRLLLYDQQKKTDEWLKEVAANPGKHIPPPDHILKAMAASVNPDPREIVPPAKPVPNMFGVPDLAELPPAALVGPPPSH